MKSKDQKYVEAVQRNIKHYQQLVNSTNSFDKITVTNYSERWHAIENMRNILSIRENDDQFDGIIISQFIKEVY